jgi:4-amino-4-deoxy-L-arabinose transferase-like glycosyltransferase
MVCGIRAGETVTMSKRGFVNFNSLTNWDKKPLGLRHLPSGNIPQMAGFSAQSVLGAGAMAILLVAGFWLRTHNLGSLGLIGDEGHQALAVKGILTHGYPLVPSGIVYTRSILYLYIQSLSALVFGLNEFSLRFPNVFFNLGTIVVVYIFGKTLFSSRIGLLAAFILTFSIWEIEITRYARMYPAFQFFYLLTTLLFYKGFIENKKNYRIFVLPSCFLAISLHVLGATLMLLFLVPLFIDNYAIVKKRALLFNMLLIIALYLFYRKILSFFATSLGTISLSQVHAETAAISTVKGVKIFGFDFISPPLRLFENLYQNNYSIFILLSSFTLVLLAYLVHGAYKNRLKRTQNILYIPIVLSFFFQQFAFALFLLVMHILWSAKNAKNLNSVDFLVIYFGASLYLAFWVLYTLLSGFSPSYVGIFDQLAGFPNYYGYFVQWFVNGWPVFTAVVAVGCVYMVYSYLDDRVLVSHLFLVLICLLQITFCALVQRRFYESRYIFHFYPLIILIFCFAINRFTQVASRKVKCLITNVGRRSFVIKPIEYVLVLVFAVVLCQDVYPSEVLALPYRGYGDYKNPIKSYLNWVPYANYHQDYRSAGLFVRRQRKPGDLVMVWGTSYDPSIYYHYVGKVDYVLMQIDSGAEALKTERGIVYYTTGSKIIKDGMSLQEMLDKNGERRIWVVSDYLFQGDYMSASMRKIRNQIDMDLVHTGEDKRTFVYLIHLRNTGDKGKDSQDKL